MIDRRILVVILLPALLLVPWRSVQGQIETPGSSTFAKGQERERPDKPLPRAGPTGLPMALSHLDLPAEMSRSAPSSPAIAEELVESGPSAPANNACSAAQAISGTGSWAFDNGFATQDGLAHAACNFFGSTQIDRDVWFRWTAPTTASFIAQTCTGTTFDTKMAVYNNAACPPGNSALLGCNDDGCSVQSRVTFNAIAGNQYLIRVGVFPGSPGGAGSLSISFQSGQSACTQPASHCQAAQTTDAYQASGLVLLDDFRTTTGGQLTSICFWGTYFDGTGNCQGVRPDSFKIRILSDFFGEPDSQIRSYTPGQYALVGPIPTGRMILGVFPEYSYRVDISVNQATLSPNTCYWLEITNDLSPSDCVWFWSKGALGNGTAFQGDPNFPLRIDSDLAFCINSPLGAATSCFTITPPSNDNCTNAVAIPCGLGADLDNLFATNNQNDPVYPCQFGGSGPGIGTMWYRFTASQTSARITTCASFMNGDTLLGVYSGTCGNLTQIACNEDFCGFKSQLCVTGLTVGQSYYIQFAASDEASRGMYRLDIACPCPAAPANDACSGAALVTLNGSGFASIIGNTSNATIDANIPLCQFNVHSAPSVWHRVVGTGRPMTASTCISTAFDSKLSVYCGSCTDLTCVGYSDDAEECGAAADGASLTWCSEAGRTYYIMVHGFAGEVGSYTLRINSPTGGVCEDPPPSCPTCALGCPTGGIQEGEVCGSSTNGGCNSFPESFQPISCGQMICGTVGAGSSIRDTDWYQFTISQTSLVSWTVQSEAPVEVFLLTSDCQSQVTLAQGIASRCGSTTATAVLEPGIYRAFVAPVVDGYPCDVANEYTAMLSCGTLGACCTGADCIRTTESDCALRSGVYGGDGVSCPLSYEAQSCSTPFENIAGTGTQIMLTGDGGALAVIGFPFKLYGVEVESLWISANGYLTLSNATSFSQNAPIPTAASPNALIAPFWDDLDPSVAGTVHYELRGIAPDRRFIVQWTDVPQFLETDANDFQAILYEGSNCIEFRYGLISPELVTGDFTIGVENETGTVGTGIAGSTVASGACRRLCPVLSPQGCTAAFCFGDANGDGMVTFLDVATVLVFWGSSGPNGDANNDQMVNFSDIAFVLVNWANMCR